ncbi:MAG: TetR family transcriptional regulator [Chloroflexota bacterium]
MTIKQRAVTEEQRLERRQALVEAAWRLFQDKAYQAINIADVASAAGLAKGTVYLYFGTKEALFLAVQEQQLAEWSNALAGQLAGLAGCGQVGAVADVVCGTLSQRPALTRLFAILHVVLEQNIAYPTALAFKQMLLERILRTGAALEACLPALPPGQGAQAAMWIYTFLLGLQQLTNPSPIIRRVIAQEPGMQVFDLDFCRECKAVVMALLAGLENRSDQE